MGLIIYNLIHVLDEEFWIIPRTITPDNTKTPPIWALPLIISPKKNKAKMGLKIGSITGYIIASNAETYRIALLKST